MAPTIYSQLTASMNWPFGAALAFILISLTAILTAASGIIFNRASRAGIVR